MQAKEALVIMNTANVNGCGCPRLAGEQKRTMHQYASMAFDNAYNAQSSY